MKTLIVVDDEAITREHIKRSFPWDEWGYRIVGEAANGEEALALAVSLRPDIALVDITMPVMDGLSFLKRLNEEALPTKSVVLTAHRDFEYVRQALAYGASGYILKSPISLADTKAAVDKAAAESDKDSHLRSASQTRSAIQSNRYPLRKHFFQQLLTGIYDEDQEIKLRASTLGIDLEGGGCVLLLGRVDRADAFRSRYNEQDHQLVEFSMLEIVRESLQAMSPARAEPFPIRYGELAIVLSWPERIPGKDESKEACLQAERAVSVPLRDYLGVSLTFAASGPLASPSRIRLAYKQTERLFVHRFYNDRSHTIFADGSPDYRPLTESQREELRASAALLRAEADSDSARKGLGALQAFFLRYRPEPADAVGWFGSLGASLRDAAEEPEWPDFGTAERLGDLLERLREWLRERDEAAKRSTSVRPEVASAIRYIREHIADELTVDGIAQTVGLSPSHFSFVFKKELGRSVIDYVLERRIELAKQYLREGSYRNYELAEKVGFSHYSYFSNLFKKHTGMSPNEYKRAVQPTIIR